MIQNRALKRIGKFALFVAVGFGIGGVIAAAIGSSVGGRFDMSQLFWGIMVFMIGYACQGALGGVALGLASRRGWGKVAELAVLGAVGFGFGSLVIIAVYMMFLWGAGSGTLARAIYGALLGTIEAVSLGLTAQGCATVVILALVSAFGFSTGAILFPPAPMYWLIPWSWGSLLRCALAGIIGGAFLGAALGYMEEDKRSEE